MHVHAILLKIRSYHDIILHFALFFDLIYLNIFHDRIHIAT